MKTKIETFIDYISLLVEMDTKNFYHEVQLGNKQTGKDFTDIVKKARDTNDKRTEAKNGIEQTLSEIMKENGLETKNVAGNIAESFSFLIDVFVINHLKVWFLEEEIRLMNRLEDPDPERMRWLVNSSREANDNRIKLRELLSRKLEGILTGTEGLGSEEPKFFSAIKRK